MSLLLRYRCWSPGRTAAAAGTHREGAWDAGCGGITTRGARDWHLEIRGGEWCAAGSGAHDLHDGIASASRPRRGPSGGGEPVSELRGHDGRVVVDGRMFTSPGGSGVTVAVRRAGGFTRSAVRRGPRSDGVSCTASDDPHAAPIT